MGHWFEATFLKAIYVHFQGGMVFVPNRGLLVRRDRLQ